MLKRLVQQFPSYSIKRDWGDYLTQKPLKINSLWKCSSFMNKMHLHSGQTLPTLHAINKTMYKNTSRNKCFRKSLKCNMQLGEMLIFKAARGKPVSFNLQSERFAPCTHTFLTAYPFLVRWDGNVMQSKTGSRDANSFIQKTELHLLWKGILALENCKVFLFKCSSQQTLIQTNLS